MAERVNPRLGAWRVKRSEYWRGSWGRKRKNSEK